MQDPILDIEALFHFALKRECLISPNCIIKNQDTNVFSIDNGNTRYRKSWPLNYITTTKPCLKVPHHHQLSNSQCKVRTTKMPHPLELSGYDDPREKAKAEAKTFAIQRESVADALFDMIGLIREGESTIIIEAALGETRYNFVKYVLNPVKQPENKATMGRCFRMRADLTTQTMDELGRMLSREFIAHDCPEQRYVRYVLEMLAIQVGRLSLNGYGEEGDRYAETMDRDSVLLDERWCANGGHPQEAELQAIWARLRMAHPTCACCQCTRRNQRTVPR